MATAYLAHMYFNTSRNRFFTWTPQDSLQKSAFTMPVTADTPEEAAEQVFMIFNRDDRPNGQTETSLSIGDLVVLVPQTEAHPSIVLWCAMAGFKRCTQEQIDECMAVAEIAQ